ncbi:MAG: hypothetical protein ACK2U9_12005, partial [Anaerolineae bacterium]
MSASSSPPSQPEEPRPRGILVALLVALGIMLLLFLCRLLLPRGLPPVGGITPTPFAWSVATMLPAGAPISTPPVTPGFYCNSCGSSQCRSRCASGGIAAGMHNRFLWCEVMPSEGVYSLGVVMDWVRANEAAGLRSVIGFSPKTDRNVAMPNRGSCTDAGDGSPSWMLVPGSVYEPLQNGQDADASYHLNYHNQAVQSQLRQMLQQLRQDIAALPPDVRDSIDSIEVDIGHDGELDAARNYQDYPADNPLLWRDLDMYRCVYAGYTWHRDLDQQRCTDADGAPIDPLRAYGAMSVWRNEVVKPIIDIYGQELSTVTQGELGRPLTLMVAGQLLAAAERADPCTGCDGQNFVDYAFTQYGMGDKTSGVNPDLADGQQEDPLNLEYRNWPNIFKLDWPSRVMTGEHGTNVVTSGHCCDDPKELYWAVLNALDKHLVQLHFPSTHIAQTGTGAEEAREIFMRYAGHGPEDTPDVWIVFRDTEGTVYPDGDNGSPQGNPPGRIPCCRWLPNYEWFIYQRNPQTAQVVRQTGLPNSY